MATDEEEKTPNPTSQPEAEDVEAPEVEASDTQPLVQEKEYEDLSPSAPKKVDWREVLTVAEQNNTWIILLMIGASSWYALGVTFFCLYEDLDLIDGWYLTTVTVTTVGYGVIVPSDELSRMFVSFYMLISIFLIAYGILNFTAFLLSTLEKSVLNDNIQEESQSIFKLFGMKAGLTIFIMFLIIAVGTLLGVYHFDFSWVNSFYWAITTLTTVGYGDFVPKGGSQRVTGGLYALFGTAIMALSVTQLMAILIATMKRDQFVEYMSPPLTAEALDALDVSGVKESGGTIVISRDHYIRFMLIRGGFVDPQVIQDFDASFDRLDADNNGILDKADLGNLAEGDAGVDISAAFSHIGHTVL